MNRLSWIVTVVTGAGMATACGKSGGDTPEAAKVVEPFKGPLTVAKVMAVKGTFRVTDPWDAAYAKLQAAVGAPTKIDGDKHFWAAMEGDDCAYFYVQREDGKAYNLKGSILGTGADPQTVAKDGPVMNRAECLTLVGKGVAEEDPKAEGPRTDGMPYSVSEVESLAVAGRSKWKAQQIKVTGLVKQLMGEEVLLGDPANAEARLRCRFDAGVALPAQGATVVLQGTVEVSNFVRGDGTPGMEATLVACTPAKG